jgi:CheY-like chemotaxis protein
VIFLDLGMPGMDGFETARHLRRLRELDGTLLVAMTGYGQESARQRASQVDSTSIWSSPLSRTCSARSP